MRTYTTIQGLPKQYLQSRNIPKIQCYCRYCTKPFIGFQGKKYCSRQCTAYDERTIRAKGPVLRMCVCCNRPFYTISQTAKEVHCSIDCRKASEADRVIRRRRAYMDRDSEKISKLVVFERYQWHCAMCGAHTPKTLMGSYLPNEPTLDHIIPLSKQGKHNYNNVQLLCRRCNCHVKNNR